MATSKKREESNLDEALSAAESGDTGRMLKGAAEQIEPRAEFARQLEVRLSGQQAEDNIALAQQSSVGPSAQPSLKVMRVPGPVSSLRNLSGRPRLFTRVGWAASVVVSMAGVAAVLLVFVFMASMFQVRKDANELGQTPTAVSGAIVEDSHTVVLSLTQLFTLKTGLTFGLQLAWSPDGQVLAIGGGNIVQVWSRSTGRLLYQVSVDFPGTLQWSPDGTLLAIVSGKDGILLLDPVTGKVRTRLAEESPGSPEWLGPSPAMAWSPDGEMLAAASTDLQPTPTVLVLDSTGHDVQSFSSLILVWDVNSGKVRRRITISSVRDFVNSIHKLLWSPDGRALATLSGPGMLDLWDPSSGELLRHLGKDTKYNTAFFSWSPDGSTLSVVSDRAVQLWDASTGELMRTLPAQVPGMPTPVPTTDMTGGVPTQSPVPPTWNPATLTAIVQPPPVVSPTPDPDSYYYITDVAWSPDGRTIAVCDGGHIRLWDPRTGALKRTISGSVGYWLAWSPDSQVLAASAGVIRFWDPSNGQLLRTLEGERTYALTWSPDGRALAQSKQVMSENNDVIIWGTGPGPEPTDTPDTRTSLPVATMQATATSVATSTALESTAEVEPTPTSTYAPTASGTSLPATSPTASPDPRQVCSGWSVVASPNVDKVNELQAVAAISGNDVWAVGYSSTGDMGYQEGTPVPSTERTLIMHWDGTRWSIVPSPSLGKRTNRLESVAAVSKDDVWAVGYYSDGSGTNQPLTSSQTLAIHWDGQTWKTVVSPDGKGATLSSLTGVVALSSDNIWAVGTYGSYRENEDKSKAPIESSRTLIIHWDGKRWSQIESPNPSTIANSLTAIAAVSSNDIWAVGSYTESVTEYNYTTNRPLFLHWNGEAWSNVAGPDLKGYIVHLASISVLQSNDIWVAGYYNGSGDPEGSTLVLNWDGKSWQEVPGSRAQVGTGSGFQAVAAIAADNVWAAYGYWSAALQQWHGQYSSTFFSNGLNSSTDASINGLAALSATDIWAVGIQGQPGKEHRTLAIHYSGPGCITPGPNP